MPTKKNATVDIVINVPLSSFEMGQPLKATGDIVSGHWVNLSGNPTVSIIGLPEGTDLVGTFNAFRKSLTLRHVTERAAPKEVQPKADRKPATKLFG
tara:strand:- start:223 stop:513 length:291 start_codon:yes stop_codon:yes gene_type:complete